MEEDNVIRRQTSTHRVGERVFKAGHYDLIMENRVEHFHSEREAMNREKQVEMFKHMEKK